MVSNTLPQTFKALQSQGPNQPPKIETLPLSKPGPNQVIVKIEYTPINPSDIYFMYGKHGMFQGKSLVGNEGSGTVVAVGDNLVVPHKIGDRVHVIGPGAMAEYLITKSESVFPIQGDLPFDQAASHFINPMTVHHMGYLAEKGGHKAAIHTAGSSALGKMLIRYFKHKGIKLINIVRRDEYIDELLKEGADYVLNSQKPDFEEKLQEIAKKENATISFDALAGDFTAKVIRAQPQKSICYIYGVLAGTILENFSITDLLMQRKQISTLVFLDHVEEMTEKGEIGKIFNELHGLLGTVFKSQIQKVYGLEDFQQAVEWYESHSSKGKVLLKP